MGLHDTAIKANEDAAARRLWEYDKAKLKIISALVKICRIQAGAGDFEVSVYGHSSQSPRIYPVVLRSLCYISLWDSNVFEKLRNDLISSEPSIKTVSYDQHYGLKITW